MPNARCERTKLQQFLKAIHNDNELVNIGSFGVKELSYNNFWKRFTTLMMEDDSGNGCERTKLQQFLKAIHNCKRRIDCWFNGVKELSYNNFWKRFTTEWSPSLPSVRCERTKLQQFLKAIHNETRILFKEYRGVKELSYNNFWKRFTTAVGAGQSPRGCERTKLQQFLKAIHNDLEII